MIVSRIDGGLGNQLFQYAYGYYLAQRHATSLRLDTSAYADAPSHGYLLDHYCISAQPLANDDQLIPRRYRAREPRYDMLDYLGFRSLRRTKEKPFGFREEHLTAPDNRYLVGYWQSERFFPEMRDALLVEFQLKTIPTLPTQRLIEQVQQCRSIAVHIRRGDYLNGSAASIYSHLDIEYYQRAVSDWASNWHGVKVFVFSNDIAWCRQQLRLPCPTHFIDHTTTATAYEDLEIMRHVQCCVIANSTFSWWGGWLNDRSDKVVYAPDDWFRPGTYDSTHIIPAGWRRIPQNKAQQAA